MKEQILKELNQIFCEVFDDESIVLEDTTDSADIPDWDSFMQISLVVAIEDFFGIKLTVKEVSSLKNVGEMVEYIQKRME